MFICYQKLLKNDKEFYVIRNEACYATLFCTYEGSYQREDLSYNMLLEATDIIITVPVGKISYTLKELSTKNYKEARYANCEKLINYINSFGYNLTLSIEKHSHLNSFKDQECIVFKMPLNVYSRHEEQFLLVFIRWLYENKGMDVYENFLDDINDDFIWNCSQYKISGYINDRHSFFITGASHYANLKFKDSEVFQIIKNMKDLYNNLTITNLNSILIQHVRNRSVQRKTASQL